MGAATIVGPTGSGAGVDLYNVSATQSGAIVDDFLDMDGAWTSTFGYSTLPNPLFTTQSNWPAVCIPAATSNWPSSGLPATPLQVRGNAQGIMGFREELPSPLSQRQRFMPILQALQPNLGISVGVRFKMGYEAGTSAWLSFRIGYTDDDGSMTATVMKAWEVRWDTVGTQYILASWANTTADVSGFGYPAGATAVPTGVLSGAATAYGPITTAPSPNNQQTYTNYLEVDAWQTIAVDFASGTPPTAVINGVPVGAFPAQPAGNSNMTIREICMARNDNLALPPSNMFVFVDMIRYSWK
jgi:hypothetical protein